jgi:hypothetical protein
MTKEIRKNLIKLPKEVYQEIEKYVDINNLLDTTLALINIKKEIKKWKLIKFFSYKFYIDVDFREKIISKIYKTDKQLYLDLSNLNLYNRENIIDMNTLTNVHTLNLDSCENITDVSALKNVHTLDLGYCKNIITLQSIKFLLIWESFSENTNIFELDFKFLKNRIDLIREELMMRCR